jgi:L-amino acid N-acyltransferase YncA
MASDNYSLEICQPLEDQARLILEWRNDPETRAASFRSKIITWEEFWPEFRGNYFRNSKLPPVFVVHAGERVAYMGFQTRVHPQAKYGNCCNISVNVNPKIRSRGVGTASLLLAAVFLKNAGIDEVLAEIKCDNDHSIRVFEKVGFQRFESTKRLTDAGEVNVHRYILRLNAGAKMS